MSHQARSSKTLWTETVKKLAENIVMGFADREFTCPVFKTRHSIPKSPILNKGHSIYFIKYRGSVYFLRQFFKHEDKKYFFRFGLVETVNSIPSFREIMDISEDLTIKYYYNTSGFSSGVSWVNK